MFKIKPSFIDKILDILIRIVFIGIGIALAPAIFGGEPIFIVYLWIVSVILIFALLIHDLRAYLKRPFAKRFKNEEEAMDYIKNMINNTNSSLYNLSKVGTSIFFAFKEYSKLLEKGATIHVLVVDPEDESLIKLVDNIYTHQTEISNRWNKLVNLIRLQLDVLLDDGEIDEHFFKKITRKIDKCSGYHELILISIHMWKHALDRANERLCSKGKQISVHGLEIRTYNVFPDIKVWISDEKACALGNYDALHLGRDNPIYVSQKSEVKEVENWHFDTAMRIWKHKFKKSKKHDINSLDKVIKD